MDRTFDAPIEKVWDAWTKAEQLQKWFGPKGNDILQNIMDLKVGGIYHYGLKTPEGDSYWGRWKFLDIQESKNMVFLMSFADENANIVHNPWNNKWPLLIHSTITFEEIKNQTKITLILKSHEAVNAEYEAFQEGAASMTQGWTGTLEQLEELLKQL
ncbi:MAG: SRPBCC domain-containing protein [Candidatus Nitrohelix vancouverensis]|uniref:SRPBCC domain-containing protein n=1 Tax=Candidatus Nitrohelix vancouverensis TaxID=2705534 RepID=A0A7T0C516_9BACT|nr:MAG: SRPBCC domain-containing protein [Candidatus Nitrohelix vancouverensis]